MHRARRNYRLDEHNLQLIHPTYKLDFLYVLRSIHLIWLGLANLGFLKLIPMSWYSIKLTLKLHTTICGLSWWMNERHACSCIPNDSHSPKIETNFPKNGGLGFFESLLCWDLVAQAGGDNCHTFQLAVS